MRARGFLTKTELHFFPLVVQVYAQTGKFVLVAISLRSLDERTIECHDSFFKGALQDVLWFSTFSIVSFPDVYNLGGNGGRGEHAVNVWLVHHCAPPLCWIRRMHQISSPGMPTT